MSIRWTLRVFNINNKIILIWTDSFHNNWLKRLQSACCCKNMTTSPIVLISRSRKYTGRGWKPSGPRCANNLSSPYPLVEKQKRHPLRSIHHWTVFRRVHVFIETDVNCFIYKLICKYRRNTPSLSNTYLMCFNKCTLNQELIRSACT